ncbi:uncharacterized protein LOC134812877 [Bolinopsis microptera]|uniref:uncharacterized protein LOC134812877 n=1 Tax=Bolinopsis microptera TaxID=2820187 RepID=UPI003078A9A7
MKATGTVPIREQNIVPPNSSIPSVVPETSVVSSSEKANGLNVEERMTRSGRKWTVAHQPFEADRNTTSDSSIMKHSGSEKKCIETETSSESNPKGKNSLGLKTGTIPDNIKLIKSPSLRRRKQIVPPTNITTLTSEESPTRKAKRPLTLTKRSPALRDMTPLPNPWDDTVKVKLRGSTVFISRCELAGGYPDILNKLSVALLIRPDDIRSVTNTTSSTQLKPGQDTFSRTLQHDDSLEVFLRRPTEASDQSATAADEDLKHLQNVLLMLVRFPVSAPEDNISSKRVVWVANICTSTPGYTSYLLTNGTKGSLRDDHVTYMKCGDSVSSLSYLGSSEVTPASPEIGTILDQFSKLSDMVAIATQDPENEIYLKYWYRDHIFTCFLLNDFTLQIDFSLSQTSVVLNVKKDYYCHLRSDSVLDEGSLSFKVLSSELSDKLAYVANIALPTIIEDVTS